MVDEKECNGFMGRFFGHNYKARYTSKFRGGKIRYETARELKHFKEHTYHGDVCKRCGDVINLQGTK